MEKKLEEKYEFIKGNLPYLLAPYFILDSRSYVTDVDSKHLKPIPKELLQKIIDYLLDNGREEALITYLDDFKNSYDCHVKYNKMVYLGMRIMSRNMFSYDQEMRITFLDVLKKYLNKEEDMQKLTLLKKLYELEKNSL